MMMDIYLAQRNYDYEGFEVIGVFKTKEAAQKCCDEDINKNGRENGDSHEVARFKVED